MFSHTQGHTWLLGGRTGMNTQLGNKEPSPRSPRPQRQGCWGPRRDRWGQGSQRGWEYEQARRRLSGSGSFCCSVVPCDYGGDDSVQGGGFKDRGQGVRALKRQAGPSSAAPDPGPQAGGKHRVQWAGVGFPGRRAHAAPGGSRPTGPCPGSGGCRRGWRPAHRVLAGPWGAPLLRGWERGESPLCLPCGRGHVKVTGEPAVPAEVWGTCGQANTQDSEPRGLRKAVRMGEGTAPGDWGGVLLQAGDRVQGS